MAKHVDNETNKRQIVADFIRKTYFKGCKFHDRFVADCDRCLAETQRVLDEEK
jgi:hypothetical protein